MKLPKVVIHTDGSYTRSNNGCGYSALMQYGNQWQVVYGGGQGATNDRMELFAVHAALRYLNQPCEIDLISDSMYVVNGINSWMWRWAQSDWKKLDGGQVANLDIWQALFEFAKQHKIRATWVKGHNGDPRNEVVDYFANRSALGTF